MSKLRWAPGVALVLLAACADLPASLKAEIGPDVGGGSIMPSPAPTRDSSPAPSAMPSASPGFDATSPPASPTPTTATGPGFPLASHWIWDAGGNMVVSDPSQESFDQVSPAGNVTTLVSGMPNPTAVAFWNGALYVATQDGASGSEAIYKVSDGIATRWVSLPSFSFKDQGMWFDPSGNLYVADGQDIEEIAPSGTVTTADSPSGSPEQGISDSAGDIFYGCASDGYIREVTANNSVMAFNTGAPGIYGLSLDPTQTKIYYGSANGFVGEMDVTSPHATASVVTIPTNFISGIAVDAEGNLWLASNQLNSVPGGLFEWNGSTVSTVSAAPTVYVGF